jgi:hypothetical protein
MVYFLFSSLNQYIIFGIELPMNYQELPISFIGSVAFYFEGLLRQIVAEFEVKIEEVIQSLITGLVS